MSQPNTPLEGTYRRALLAYPGSWRRQNGEEMVGIMLDVADQDRRTRATVGEVVNLIGSGLAARCERLLPGVPGQGRDRIACLSLSIASALAAIMLVLGELGRWFRYNSYPTGMGLFGPFTTSASVVYVLVLGAFLAASLGWTAARRILLVLAILAAAFLLVMPMANGDAVTTSGVVTVGWPVPVVFILASLLSLPGNPTSTVHQYGALTWGAPVAAIVFGCTSYIQGGGAQKSFYTGDVVMSSDVLVIAAISALGAGLLAFGITGRFKPITVLIAVGSLTLPIKALFVSFLPNNAWSTLTAVCFTAAIFIAWQVHQRQERSNSR